MTENQNGLGGNIPEAVNQNQSAPTPVPTSILAPTYDTVVARRRQARELDRFLNVPLHEQAPIDWSQFAMGWEERRAAGIALRDQQNEGASA